MSKDDLRLVPQPETISQTMVRKGYLSVLVDADGNVDLILSRHRDQTSMESVPLPARRMSPIPLRSSGIFGACPVQFIMKKFQNIPGKVNPPNPGLRAARARASALATKA